MTDHEPLTTDAVTACLHGLTEILAVLHRQYPQESAAGLAEMLRGSVETLDQLRVIWPDAEDDELIAAATELQDGAKSMDLLRMALATALGKNGGGTGQSPAERNGVRPRPFTGLKK